MVTVIVPARLLKSLRMIGTPAVVRWGLLGPLRCWSHYDAVPAVVRLVLVQAVPPAVLVVVTWAEVAVVGPFGPEPRGPAAAAVVAHVVAGEQVVRTGRGSYELGSKGHLHVL